MKKLLICLVLGIPLQVNAQMQACSICQPQVLQPRAISPIDGDDRAWMLETNGSGWIEFSMVRDPGARYLIQRLNGPGDIQWTVTRRGGAGNDWSWARRWGLPIMATGGAPRDQASMVTTIMGPHSSGGIQLLWDRLLANPVIAIDRQGIPGAPVMVQDGGAVTRYEGWVAGVGQGNGTPLFARRLFITPTTSSAAVEVGIIVHSVVLAHPATVPAGWPMTGR